MPETMNSNDNTCHDKQVIENNFNLFCASIKEMNDTNTAEHVDSSYTDYITNKLIFN